MYEYEIREVTKVVDGDTLDLAIDLGSSVSVTERFRIYAINAPETRSTDVKEKAAGLVTKDVVAKLLGAQTEALQVKTHTDGKEKYGRYLAEIYFKCDETGHVLAAPKSLSDYLIEQKLAVAYFGGKRYACTSHKASLLCLLAIQVHVHR